VDCTAYVSSGASESTFLDTGKPSRIGGIALLVGEVGFRLFLTGLNWHRLLK
jgi:hypothetical protein